MKSAKEMSLDKRILGMTAGLAHRLAELMIADPEIQEMQEYANVVSIRRLNFNDHGPVHMRTALINALNMLGYLHESGIKTSLEQDEAGSYEDSRMAVMLASFLHDIGMAVGRQNHEMNSAIFAYPVITRLLQEILPTQLGRLVAIRSVAIEGIEGHMTTQRIHSLEAGLILIADGCDMKKGRSRIPMLLSTEPKAGDIHQYSAAAITDVVISHGQNRPIQIDITMQESVGFFQVEEVLLHKINTSPVKQYVELNAAVLGQEPRRYLG
ncbi:MAG: phosphohydrolase [Spirochaetes bacterium GWD1_61_31]|nr:MAG: phosphohydrolase [Spirochaetes bacterium GWB1_60_80]OHD31518.1 MAG: phosphohydrolase [Spirochaetes bacterium GWC1_61_12]OHD43295.1 MAG: phosphohydrolase [Spirochaetes bacterium GWD1_61_31]OHD45615.1 MAG: phosphohydrolase [Spirochaetes bacterium GWE1_60_18]OHD60466.1 MAG: phosphohydrolase [Spirochaetes bacterium GWF1_60_12]HAP44733.1 phosphohydrolase [Spirochaetaceae bacterium]